MVAFGGQKKGNKNIFVIFILNHMADLLNIHKYTLALTLDIKELQSQYE